MGDSAICDSVLNGHFLALPCLFIGDGAIYDSILNGHFVALPFLFMGDVVQSMTVSSMDIS